MYGLPMASGADVLFINLALWDKAGLDRAEARRLLTQFKERQRRDRKGRR